MSRAVLRPDLRGHRRSPEKDTLTKREKQVIELLAEGKSTKEVASLLNLSVKTAETHRSIIMSKLGLHSVSELVLYAVRNSIVIVPASDSASSSADISSGETPDGAPDPTSK